MAQEGRQDQQQLHFEPADPCSWLEMNRNWLNYSPAPSSGGAQLRRISQINQTSRLGDRCGEPAAARHNLIEGASQDAGFHATFSLQAALL
jgi:hypothetical protein